MASCIKNILPLTYCNRITFRQVMMKKIWCFYASQCIINVCACELQQMRRTWCSLYITSLWWVVDSSMSRLNTSKDGELVESLLDSSQVGTRASFIQA